MGVERPAWAATVFRVDVAGALGLAPGAEVLAIRRRCGAVAPMLGEWVAELRVDQIGQRRPIGFITDVPGLQPCQLGVGRAGAGLRHLGQAQVDRVGEDRGQQQVLVLGLVARFQVREVPGEARPLVHLQQQFGDLDVRQDHRGLVDQGLRGVGYRRIERRDLQARLRDNGVWQLVGRRHAVDGGELRFQQRQSLMQVLVAVGGHGQRQFAGQLEAGEFRGRHQVVLKILELAGALHPDVARAQCVLHFRQCAQLVIAPVDAGVGHHQLLPARLDEVGRRIGGHLAGVVAVHAAQHLDGVEHILGSGRGSQLEHSEKFRRVAAQGSVALADAVQEIEVLGLRKFLRLGDAFGEGIPGHDGLDGSERIVARLLGLDQRLADAPEKPHLGVDRLAGRLELLLMLVLGGVEQLAQDAVVQVDDFVGNGGHALDGERHQGRITALRLELGQVGGRHLATLAGDLEQAVLVNQALDARRQVERLPRLEAFYVFEHVPRVRLDWRLAQPGQPGCFTVVAALEQVIKATAMRVRQRFGKGIVDAPVGAGDRLGADALDNIQRRQDDVPVAKRVEVAAGQHDALVGLQGQLGRGMNSLPIVRQAERFHAQIRAQLKQVFASGFLPLGILWPTGRVEPQLPSDPLQQGHRHRSVGQQALTREAQ